jgi:hypothetical protein
MIVVSQTIKTLFDETNRGSHVACFIWMQRFPGTSGFTRLDQHSCLVLDLSLFGLEEDFFSLKLFASQLQQFHGHNLFPIATISLVIKCC